MSASIEAAVFALLAEAGEGRSIAPEAVARAASSPETWRKALPQVRATAVGLARQGRLEILRHNRRVDPDAFKGVYRLRLPAGGPGDAPDDG